ncbi:MAG: ABC transporter substrate-binding protein, partial [Prevotella sp.]
MKKLLLVAIAPALILVSCAGGKTNNGSDVAGDTMVFKYAHLLEMIDYDNYTVAKVADPWHKGKTLHTYVLVKRDAEEPATLPEGTVIHVPVKRAIPFTTVHSSLIMALGRHSSIVGVADLRYIKIPYVKEECAAGRMSDVGSAMSPNIEKILDTRPDVLLVSPFENSGGYGKLDEIGIPMIECAEYMEPSALGRAEWTRFYGILFGAAHQADSLFAVVDSSYQALKSVAGTTATSVTATMDKMTGSVWYVPGGRSTIGTMIADAGISYPFA